MSAVLDNALLLARQKVRFFPVRPNSKLPAVADFASKASSDPEALNDFFGATDYNSGIACGKVAEGLYLVGFDIDTKPGKNGYATLELLEELDCLFPKTWSQKTPSGGEHRLFWSPVAIRQGTNVLGPGIDLRGEGGYLVGPGSSLGGVYYLPLLDLPIAQFPAWAIAKYEKVATVHQLGTPKTIGAPVANQVLALSQAVAYLQGVPPSSEGGRSNDCFKVAARLKDFGLDQSQVLDVLLSHWRCEPMLEIGELNFTINNAYKYSKSPIGIAAPENLFTQEVDAPPAGIEEGPIDQFNKQFFYYAADGISRVCEESDRDGRFHLERYPVDKFHEKFSHRKIMHNGKEVKLTKVWMEHVDRRTYKRLNFYPGVNPRETGCYNTWRGFETKPPVAGDPVDPKGQRGVDLFLDHCRRNICGGNEDHAKWLFAFMAHIFQKPHEKPGVSLVLQGKKGTGKTILSEILGEMIGNAAVILADRNHMLGHFNSIMEHKLLVTLDEAFWSGDKAVEGTLKHLVTGTTRAITHKGAETYNAIVYDRVIIIGNESRLVPATMDERRYTVFAVGDGNRRDRKFFGEMRRGLQNHGGLSLLLKFFLEYDLSDIDVSEAIDTKALNDQKEQSYDVVDQWWLNCLQEEQVFGSGQALWPEYISNGDLYSAFLTKTGSENYRGFRPARLPFLKRMREYMAACKSHTSKNQRGYNLAPIELMREEWDKCAGFVNDWGG